MNQSKKLSRAEFLQKKEEYFKILSNYVQGKSEEELKNFQDELLTYDLSEIPASDWNEINWYVGAFNNLIFSADFSKTHANIDFRIFKIFPVDHTTSEHWIKKCNFLGCDVAGLDQLDLYSFNDLTNDDVKKVFGNDTIQNNPREFPSDLIPEEIQKRFYSEQLTYEDLLKYPELFEKHICKNENRPGIEGKETGVYSWNLDVLKKITKEDSDLYYYFIQTNYYPESQDLKLDADKLKEKIAKNLYQTLIPKSTTNLLRNFKDYPSFFFQYYPEFHPSLPDQDVEKRFYERRLTIRDVRENYENLKDIDEQILLPKFYPIIKQFGGIQNFLNYIPQSFDKYLREYGQISASPTETSMNSENNEQLAMSILHSVMGEDMDFCCIEDYIAKGGKIDTESFPRLSKLIEKYGLDVLEKNRSLFSKTVQINNYERSLWSLFINNFSDEMSFENNLKQHFFTAEELKSVGIPEAQLEDAIICSNQALYGDLQDILTLYDKYPQLTKLANQKNFFSPLCEYFGYEELVAFNKKTHNLLNQVFDSKKVNQSNMTFGKLLNNKIVGIPKYAGRKIEDFFFTYEELAQAGISKEKLESAFQIANEALLGDWDDINRLYEEFPQLTELANHKIFSNRACRSLGYEQLFKFNSENFGILNWRTDFWGNKLSQTFLERCLAAEENTYSSFDIKRYLFTKEELVNAGIPDDEIQKAFLISNRALYTMDINVIQTLYRKYPQLTKIANNKQFSHKLFHFFTYEDIMNFNADNDFILQQKLLDENNTSFLQIITDEYERIMAEMQPENQFPSFAAVAQKCFILKKDLQELGYEGTELENVFSLANQGLLSGNVTDLFTVLKKYPNLESLFLKKQNIIFKGKDKILNFVKDKKRLLTLAQKYEAEDVKKIIGHIAFSNSSEIQRIGEELIDPILSSENPNEMIKKIESIFLLNKLPYVAKTFLIFKTLHPSYLKRYGSPMLTMASDFNKDLLIFSDLIKASFGSNNRSIQEYFDTIERGNILFERVFANKDVLNSLNEKDQETLHTYLDYLNELYNQTLPNRKTGFSNAHQLSPNVYQNVVEFAKLFSKDGKFDYNLPDRLTRMFCHFAGFDTLKEVRDYCTTKIKQADSKHREEAKHPFVLEAGDFVKGLNSIDYIENILQNGSVCKEFLGSDASVDATPLDTDLTRLGEAKNTFYDTFDQRIDGYGNIYAVLKNDDRFVITDDGEHPVDKRNFDRKKIEAFQTAMLTDKHYGIRTGFASSEIDYFIQTAKDPKLGFEIAKNGFYIPIVNERGTLIFTPQQYDEIRSKMQGLSYYGMGDTYEFASNDELYSDEIKAIILQNKSNKQETDKKRDAIINLFEKCLRDSDLKLVYELEQQLTPGTVEFIDTGSTGRGTNKPNDGDFDFMVRVDREIFADEKKLEDFKDTLRQEFKKRAKEKEETGTGNFRYKKVSIDGLDEPVDIDMTFIQKTDKISYSTDMCLRDRLDTIRNLSEEKYQAVLANIILAKKVLKEGKCYKPHHAPQDIREGGLGGVGVENWILQNGGSFYRAAKTFLDVAKKTGKFDTFKDYYKIWDFGKNHMFDEKKKYPHDEFVYDNMDEDGFKKMTQTLEKYVQKVETEKHQDAVEQQADSIVEAMTQENFTKQPTQSNHHLGYAETTSLKLLYMISILAILLLIACCIIY